MLMFEYKIIYHDYRRDRYREITVIGQDYNEVRDIANIYISAYEEIVVIEQLNTVID